MQEITDERLAEIRAAACSDLIQSLVARLDRVEGEKHKIKTALAEMLALWERVHGGAVIGRPTVNAAKKALNGEG
jgi:hypothetical protein